MSPAPSSQLNALLETMRKLRSPQGCNWDREQTPSSLRPYILEEAYELIDAIEQGDSAEILSELGDLLLQIVFLAQIFTERGEFGLDEIAESINSKLMRRHPHIFAADNEVDHPTWEEIKQQELIERGKSPQFADRLPRTLPSLKLANKVLHHLLRNEPQKSFNRTATKEEEEHIGGRLFKLVRQAQCTGVDADLALRKYLLRLLAEDSAKDSKC